MTVRWGIVGTGRMAREFAAALRTTPGGRLAAVASRANARAAAFQAATGAEHAFGDTAGLLACPDVDICYIATPTHRHHQDCLAALAAGKAVLCEKPLATTAAEARDITEAAAAAGVFCMEALWTQFVPAVTAAEKLLRQGELGDALTLTASFGLPTPMDADTDLFRSPGGGALLDRGCYPISLALRFLGEVATATGRTTCLPNGVDLSAELILTFRSGSTALIATSLTSALANTLVIAGSQGRLVLHDPITCPTLLSVTRVGAATGDTAPADTRLRRIARTLPGMTELARLRHTRLRWLPTRGRGYGYQIAEVHRCLAAGQIQNLVASWALSVATAEVIDQIKEGQGSAP